MTTTHTNHTPTTQIDHFIIGYVPIAVIVIVHGAFTLEKELVSSQTHSDQ